LGCTYARSTAKFVQGLDSETKGKPKPVISSKATPAVLNHVIWIDMGSRGYKRL